MRHGSAVANRAGDLAFDSIAAPEFAEFRSGQCHAAARLEAEQAAARCGNPDRAAAVAAAEPPLEPPDEYRSDHGLRVGPKASGSV